MIGALAQRSRFCVTGSFSNYFIVRDATLMRGLVALFLAALVVSILSGVFNPGLLGQPGSHPDHLWNFLTLLDHIQKMDYVKEILRLIKQ